MSCQLSVRHAFDTYRASRDPDASRRDAFFNRSAPLSPPFTSYAPLFLRHRRSLSISHSHPRPPTTLQRLPLVTLRPPHPPSPSRTAFSRILQYEFGRRRVFAAISDAPAMISTVRRLSPTPRRWRIHGARSGIPRRSSWEAAQRTQTPIHKNNIFRAPLITTLGETVEKHRAPLVQVSATGQNFVKLMKWLVPENCVSTFSSVFPDPRVNLQQGA